MTSGDDNNKIEEDCIAVSPIVAAFSKIPQISGRIYGQAQPEKN